MLSSDLEYLINQSRRPALLDLPNIGKPIWEAESIAALRTTGSNTVIHELLVDGPEIDLSLVTYHSAGDLEPFFISLLRQEFPLRKIRLLITQHAQDEREATLLREIIDKHGHAFKEITVQQQPNIGYGGGHNRNFLLSRAELFLISNVDLCYFKDTISKLVYAAMTADAGVALVEARQRPFEHPKFYNPSTLETLWSSGCCVLVRSSAFREVGGFDEAFFMYGEDVDLSLRLRSAGYRTAFCPWAGVLHAPPQEPRRQLMHQGAIDASLLISAKFGGWGDVRRAIIAAKDDAAAQGRSRYLRSPDLPRRLRQLASALLERHKHRSFGPNLFNGHDFEWRRPFRLTPSDLELAKRRLAAEQTEHPLVSIIIRATRDERIVERALRSAMFQTHPKIEVIIIEDGDARLGSLVERYREAGYQVCWVAIERAGRSLSASLGIACASGTHLAFLDDDDILFLDHIEALNEALHEDADFAAAWSVQGSQSDRSDPLNEDDYRLPPWHDRIFDLAAFSTGNCLPIQSVLFRRRDAVRVGDFDTTFDFWEDWNFFSRLIKTGTVPVVTRTTSASFLPDIAERQTREAAHSESYSLALAANQRWRAAERSGQASINLVYHRVGARDVDPYELFVSSSHILQHFEIAADRQRLLDGALAIEIHFDDGYGDILSAAVSASKDFGLDVTAFVPTAFANDGRSYLWDRLHAAVMVSTPNPQLMAFLAREMETQHDSRDVLYHQAVDRCRTSPEFAASIGTLLDTLGMNAKFEDVPLNVAEMRTMAQAGVQFGLHGHTHRSFGYMNEEQWRDELDRSCAGFGKFSDTPPRSFAFPYGSAADLNDMVAVALRQRGVQKLYSMLPCERRLGPVAVSPRWQVSDLNGIAFRLQLDALIGAAFGPQEDRVNSAPLMRTRRVHPIAIHGMS